MKKLILDFGSFKLKHQFDYQNNIVLSCYERDNHYTIESFSFHREKALEHFELYYSELTQFVNDKSLVNAHKNDVFNSVFIPLYRWMNAIDLLILKIGDKNLHSVEFISYSTNQRISIIEAEGESQGSFLYKTQNYLPYYLKSYIERKYDFKIFLKNKTQIVPHLSIYFRGLSFAFLKVLQQFTYKVTSLFREKKNFKLNEYIFLSRGIIQSQYIVSFIDLLDSDKVSVLVNESAIYPFRNLSYFKGTGREFIYIEGLIPFKTMCVSFFFSLFRFHANYFRGNKKVCFNGVPIKVSHLIGELYISQYYASTQALNFNHLLKMVNYDKVKKVFCFDMLTPQPYYVKKNSDFYTVQIQTTLMSIISQTDYVTTDFFYFTDTNTYMGHLEKNKAFNQKIGLLNNLKYAMVERKNNFYKIEILTFFTQPIFLEEELEIIKFLKEWTAMRNLKLQLKLHPRSLSQDYNNLNVPFYNSEATSIDAIKFSDIVITRNSSIGLDAWILNTPVLFMVYGKLHSTMVPFIPKDYIGVYNSKPSFTDLDYFINHLDLFYSHKFHQNAVVDRHILREELMFAPLR